RTLFEAHRERDEGAFARAADSIISEELAANHHSSATELKRALTGMAAAKDNSRRTLEMRSIPKDRRDGEDLLWVQESSVSTERVTLSPSTAERISRVLEEHRKRHRLQKCGY